MLFSELPSYNDATSSSSISGKCQVILAPSRAPQQHRTSVFLAGSTSPVPGEPDWRDTLTSALVALPVTVYNPLRPDWDGSWREDVSFAPFREQVQWELEKQDAADVVVVYFHPASKAPISLMELGLSTRRAGRSVVCCPEGYWKRGNVQLVCQRYGVECVDREEGLAKAVIDKLNSLGVKASLT
ncbi:hypothetical protein UCRPA7_563 [Phaeoacremonium minimum UCRPA7]|uniref:Nucleoside 2-deoxyribosyltransferase n=1 Tax=Phaeoacremonium minimum (strain UCR-PA7) TaxID=1286976 RepID=R8BX59_PHAM7|nr:hypothetical protein UCRPA7_563 [Phaeoacremonium minimum UCRPA7]EOO03910.1 hypothetical protein UCRPA7_563 [Phaeoacremonium minimum UCRPA7]